MMLVFPVLGLMCVAGAAGGLIDGISRLAVMGKEGDSFKATAGVSLNLYIWAKGLTGVGGSIAVLLALIVADRLPDLTHVPKDYLFLVSVGLVAGFAGQRILPAVATRLEQQIERSVEQHTEEAKEEVKREVKEDVRALERAQQNLAAATNSYQAVTAAIFDLSKGAHAQTGDLQNDAVLLEPLLPKRLGDRTLHIVLGRVYRRLGKYDEAIQVLSIFIKNNEATGKAADIAAALYNRACYYSLKSVTDKDPAHLRQKAMEDLQRSVELSDDSKKMARKDEDFNSLKQDPTSAQNFEALVGLP